MAGILARGIARNVTGILARGIARNFSAPVANRLFRGIRGQPAVDRRQFLDATRIFSSATVGNNQLLRGFIEQAAAHDHHQSLDARIFSSASIGCNANSETRGSIKIASFLREASARGIRGREIHNQFLNARNFSTVPVANNTEFFYQFEKDRRVSILGLEWRLSLNQVMVSKFKGSNLPPLKPPGCLSDPTEHQIAVSASSLIESVRRLWNQEPSCDIIHGAMYMVYTDPRFQTYNEFAKMKVLSKVLDVIHKYPQVDCQEVIHMRRRIKSFTVDDSKDSLSEDQVVARVLDVIQSHHFTYTVTRGSRFYKDLQLNYIARRRIIAALETEFKMHVPQNIDSCERAIDYVYQNQEKRMSLQEFRDQFCSGNRFKEQFNSRVIESGKYYLSWAAWLALIYMILK